jgi:hypothetical protein
MEDMAGRVFGRLTVLNFSHVAKKRSYWRCVCGCVAGTVRIVRTDHLKSGNTKSCGCLQREMTGGIHRTHGRYETPEYHAWESMKQRCYNKRHASYSDYGGRGITMCDRWLESFENFFSDMGKKPSAHHSIDRRDNDGNYDPSNCRWATDSEQRRNKRPVQKPACPSGFFGVYQKGNRYHTSIRIDGKLKHLGAFETAEEAAEEYDDVYEGLYGVRRNKTRCGTGNIIDLAEMLKA